MSSLGLRLAQSWSWRHDAPTSTAPRAIDSNNIMTTAIARDRSAFDPISTVDDSDYGSDFDEDEETALNILLYAEVGHAEQDWLQPVLPETVEPDARAPVAHIRRSSHFSPQAECSANLSAPGSAAAEESQEIDLLGAEYLQGMRHPKLERHSSD